MKKATTQPQDKYVLRLPDGLRDRIKVAAANSGRSMNAEIVWTLEKAYPDLLEQLQQAIRTLESEIGKTPPDKRADLEKKLHALTSSIFN